MCINCVKLVLFNLDLYRYTTSVMGSLKKGFRFVCRNADGLKHESSKSQERG